MKTTVEELNILLTATTSDLRKEMDKAKKDIEGLKKSAEKTQSGVMSAFNKLKQGIIALGIGKVIKDSIMTGINAIESDSLFETSLGNMADDVRSWSDEIGDALGINATSMRKNVGVIYNMTTSMGLAEDNALKMSKGITLLTEDMASFYNLDSTEAFNKLRAGLTGETEPLKALGILVDENTIKQVAYQQGIASVGSELTQQQKVLARYVAILQQTGNAQGDLARTIDSPANQLRLLKNQVSQLGLAFSNFLIPVLKAVLPYVIAFTKVITTALNGLAKFLGLSGSTSSGLSGTFSDIADSTGNISSGLGGVNSGLDSANKKAKKLKGQLAGFDEMNVLQDNSSDSDTGGASGGGTGSGGAIGGLGADGLFALGEYDAKISGLTSKSDELAQSLRNAFSGIDFTNLINSFNTLRESFEPLSEAIGGGLKWLLDNVLVPIASWTIEDVLPAFLGILSGALDIVNQAIIDTQPMFMWLWDNVLQPMAEWTGGIVADVLTAVGDALKWIADNKVAMAIIEGILLTWLAWNTAVGIWNGICAVASAVTTAFGVAFNFLTSPITLVILAIGLLVAGIILLVKNWDTVKETASNVWNRIKEIWGAVSNWFNTKVIQPVKNFFTGMWDGLKNGGKQAWEGIKSVFSSVADWFGNIFSKAWKKVKNVFSTGGKIFDGIKDGIANVFKTVVNAIIGGINKVIATPFNAINKLLNKVRNVSVAGIEPFKSLIKKDPLTVPEIPKLARGGVVSSPTVAMIGEAGKEAVVPLENNTGWIDKLADKINSNGGDGQPIQLTVKLGEDTIYNKFIEYSRRKSFETNGEVFSL